MGGRSYIPQLGRFVQTDPVGGSSPNSYDYAAQDPVNNVDLGGAAYETPYTPVLDSSGDTIAEEMGVRATTIYEEVQAAILAQAAAKIAAEIASAEERWSALVQSMTNERAAEAYWLGEAREAEEWEGWEGEGWEPIYEGGKPAHLIRSHSRGPGKHNSHRGKESCPKGYAHIHVGPLNTCAGIDLPPIPPPLPPWIPWWEPGF